MAGFGTLVTTFAANTAPFESGVNRAGASAMGFGEHVKKSTGSLGSFVKRMAAVAVASIGVYAAINQIRKGFQEMDDAAKKAAQLGMSPQALIELQYIAELTGFEVDALGVALEKMGVRIAEAVAGTGEAGAALESIGLSAQGLMAMRPEDAFRQISEAIAGIESPAEQARIAYKLFEEAGGRMLNMIRLSNSEFKALRDELHQIAPHLSSLNFENAEEMQDALTKIKYKFKILRMHLAIQLAPLLQKIATAVMQAVDWFSKWGDEMKIAFMVIGDFIKLLWQYRKVILVVVAAITLWRVSLVAWSVAKSIALSLSGPKGWYQLAGAAAAAGVAITGIMVATNKASKSLEDAKRNTDKVAESARGAGAAYQDMSGEVAKAAEEAKKLADLQHKGEQLTKTLRTPVEIFTDTLADLEEMINAGAISWETYNRAISKANEDLLKSLDTQKKINRAREKGFGAVTRGTVAAFSASQQSNREWNRLKQLQEDENRMAADRNRILNDIKANIVAAPPVAGI